MKTINFSDTLTPRQQKELARWWAFTVGLACLALGTIATITVHRALINHQQKKEKYIWQQKVNQLQQMLTHQTTLQKEEQELIKRITKLQAYGASTPAIATHLMRIMQHMRTAHAWLESLSLDKKVFELHVGCPTTALVLTLAAALDKEPNFERVSITTLQTKNITLSPANNPNGTQVLATIKGSIKHNNTYQERAKNT